MLDALIQNDVAKAQEHLALTIAALEQTGVDGDWTLGWLLALVEEPPIQLFQEKMVNLHTHPPGGTNPCGGRNSIPERNRDPQFQEEGDPEPFIFEGSAEHRIQCFTWEAAKVPKEAEGLSNKFPVKPFARHQPAAMELDKGCGACEFNGKLNHNGSSASNKKDSLLGFGTGVDFETELTLPKWCGMLTSMVLRTRSSFAFYLLKSFRQERSTTTSSTTLFPIPLPFTGLFDRMPPSMSVRDRRSLSIRRVAYIIVFALNYWYFGGPPPDMSSLGRVPNLAHRRIYKRVENFIRSDFGMPSFRVAAAGRRFPQLVARLCELSESMTRLGLGGETYTKSFAGAEEGFDAEKIPELKPYRDLQADRLRLFGKAHWDITDFLHDELIMPFREPKSILVDRIPEVWEYPKCNDSYEEILAPCEGLG